MGRDDEQRLGKYLLKSRLGQGGMGIVYLATDTRLRREVALKILPKSMSTDPDALKRFLREARVAARLNHPNVVAIHDVDQQRGLCFLVMELVTGGTAQDLMAQGPLDWKHATRIIAEACRGLGAAHAANLIHRDIKPANIMIHQSGLTKLADFGLAKFISESDQSHALTRSGTIMGTPHYMSPEQCQGENLDPRSDIYSLGATYFALLAGRPPFVETQAIQLMFSHCSKPIPDIRTFRSDLPAGCHELLSKAMAKNRGDRFQTTGELLAALEGLLSGLDHSVMGLGKTEVTAERERAASSQAPVEAHGISASGILFPTLLAEMASSPTRRMSANDLSLYKSCKKHWAAWSSRGRALLILIPLVLLLTWLGWKGSGAGERDPKVAVQPSKMRSRKPEVGHSSSSGKKHVGSTLEFVREIPAVKSTVRSVAFAADSQSVYSSQRDGAILQWDLRSGQVRRTLQKAGPSVHAIAANARWVVAAGDSQEVWLWDPQSESPKKTLRDFVTARPQESPVSAVAISPDGRRLAVASYSALRLYELSDRGVSLIKLLGSSTTGDVRCYMIHQLAFSSDSRWLATASWDQKLLAIWDAETGELDQIRKDAGRDIVAVAYIPDQHRVLFGNDDAGVQVWDVQSDQIQSLAANSPRPVRQLAVSRDGAIAVAVGEWGGRVEIIDLSQSWSPRSAIHSVSKTTNAAALAVAVSPDCSKVVTAGGTDNPAEGYLHIWNVVPRDVDPGERESAE